MKYSYSVFSCCFLISTIFAFPRYENEVKCGYQNCPKPNPNKLNVHIVPHSHDDVGWLKTVDQYYYGSKNNIQNAGVQYILDSVVQALLQNPERRFIYVETAFFYKWWQEKSDQVRNQIRNLVNNGQLEIIGGAWSMNDEAAVHYQSTIDQFTWGFKKLNETLGVCARPKIGWQIDPFGHSREMASLFSQFGFDGLFFARLDWRDKMQRLKTKKAEMLWQGSKSLGDSAQLFTSVLYNHYSAPKGFCFDILCNDGPIVEDKKSPEFNADEKAKEFLHFVRSQAEFYQSNNIIITMGDDFNYQDALSYFSNMDRLIKIVNNLNSNVTLFYSSPSCYVKALNEANLKWPTKTDDFFPYASDPHAYWNGYFTSRPTSKRFERFANNYLQIAKQQEVLAKPNTSIFNLDALKEAIGIMQHHDAITGTEKQHVADDYARILTDALEEAEKYTGSNLKNLYPETNGIFFASCFKLNISECHYTENKDAVNFIIYNPLARNVSHYVRLPVTDGTYEVLHSNKKLTVQHVPIFEMIKKIPGRNSFATHEVVFYAEDVPPLGFKSYQMIRLSRNVPSTNKESTTNKNYKLSFKNGLLQSVTRNTMEKLNIEQNYYYYHGAIGNNAEFKNRSSGAYIFRPNFQEPTIVSSEVQSKEYDGPLVKEYHQVWNKWVGQVARVYSQENHFELNWVIGPIPTNDYVGKEVITRLSTDIKSQDIFYTDANGREMIKRHRSFRETFNLTHEEPVAENYYPVTSKITIKDEGKRIQRQISILTDRAQGGASLNEGQLELMVHRKLLHDDAFGVSEALSEFAYGTGLVATGKHYVIVGENSEDYNIVREEKELATKILTEPWIFFGTEEVSQDNTENKLHTSSVRAGLKRKLPRNIHLLTLESWNEEENQVLLRLEHIFERNEDEVLSKPATVDLEDLFVDFKIVSIQEMSLGGNQLKSEVNRLKWQSDEQLAEEFKSKDIKDLKVTLQAMEIRTFILKIQRN